MLFLSVLTTLYSLLWLHCTADGNPFFLGALAATTADDAPLAPSPKNNSASSAFRVKDELTNAPSRFSRKLAAAPLPQQREQDDSSPSSNLGAVNTKATDQTSTSSSFTSSSSTSHPPSTPGVIARQRSLRGPSLFGLDIQTLKQLSTPFLSPNVLTPSASNNVPPGALRSSSIAVDPRTHKPLPGGPLSVLPPLTAAQLQAVPLDKIFVSLGQVRSPVPYPWLYGEVVASGGGANGSSPNTSTTPDSGLFVISTTTPPPPFLPPSPAPLPSPLPAQINSTIGQVQNAKPLSLALPPAVNPSQVSGSLATLTNVSKGFPWLSQLTQWLDVLTPCGNATAPSSVPPPPVKATFSASPAAPKGPVQPVYDSNQQVQTPPVNGVALGVLAVPSAALEATSKVVAPAIPASISPSNGQSLSQAAGQLPTVSTSSQPQPQQQQQTLPQESVLVSNSGQLPPQVAGSPFIPTQPPSLPTQQDAQGSSLPYTVNFNPAPPNNCELENGQLTCTSNVPTAVAGAGNSELLLSTGANIPQQQLPPGGQAYVPQASQPQGGPLSVFPGFRALASATSTKSPTVLPNELPKADPSHTKPLRRRLLREASSSSTAAPPRSLTGYYGASPLMQGANLFASAPPAVNYVPLLPSLAASPFNIGKGSDGFAPVRASPAFLKAQVIPVLATNLPEGTVAS